MRTKQGRGVNRGDRAWGFGGEAKKPFAHREKSRCMHSGQNNRARYTGPSKRDGIPEARKREGQVWGWGKREGDATAMTACMLRTHHGTGKQHAIVLRARSCCGSENVHSPNTLLPCSRAAKP
ncbi:unnamed protein product, partial [Ectocarpus sp. 12 AP-2014]